MSLSVGYFIFNDTATTEIYTLSLHDALPISGQGRSVGIAWGSQKGKGVYQCIVPTHVPVLMLAVFIRTSSASRAGICPSQFASALGYGRAPAGGLPTT